MGKLIIPFDPVMMRWLNDSSADTNYLESSKVFESGYDDPTYMTFRIEFGGWGATTIPSLDTYKLMLRINTTDVNGNISSTTPTNYRYDDFPCGLLDLNFADESIKAYPGYAFNNQVAYNAYNYLLLRNEDTRAFYLKQFIEGLYDVQRKYPYLFLKISGLNKLTEISTTRGTRLKDVLITVECIEGLSQKISTLMELYHKAVWDQLWQRWVLPENYRLFKMIIYVFERRVFHSVEANAAAQSVASSAPDTTELDSPNFWKKLGNGALNFLKSSSANPQYGMTAIAGELQVAPQGPPLGPHPINSLLPIYAYECDLCEFALLNNILDSYEANWNSSDPHIKTLTINVRNVRTYFKNGLTKQLKNVLIYDLASAAERFGGGRLVLTGKTIDPSTGEKLSSYAYVPPTSSGVDYWVDKDRLFENEQGVAFRPGWGGGGNVQSITETKNAWDNMINNWKNLFKKSDISKSGNPVSSLTTAEQLMQEAVIERPDLVELTESGWTPVDDNTNNTWAYISSFGSNYNLANMRKWLPEKAWPNDQSRIIRYIKYRMTNDSTSYTNSLNYLWGHPEGTNIYKHNARSAWSINYFSAATLRLELSPLDDELPEDALNYLISTGAIRNRKEDLSKWQNKDRAIPIQYDDKHDRLLEDEHIIQYDEENGRLIDNEHNIQYDKNDTFEESDRKSGTDNHSITDFEEFETRDLPKNISEIGELEGERTIDREQIAQTQYKARNIPKPTKSKWQKLEKAREDKRGILQKNISYRKREFTPNTNLPGVPQDVREIPDMYDNFVPYEARELPNEYIEYMDNTLSEEDIEREIPEEETENMESPEDSPRETDEYDEYFEDDETYTGIILDTLEDARNVEVIDITQAVLGGARLLPENVILDRTQLIDVISKATEVSMTDEFAKASLLDAKNERDVLNLLLDLDAVETIEMLKKMGATEKNNLYGQIADLANNSDAIKNSYANRIEQMQTSLKEASEKAIESLPSLPIAAAEKNVKDLDKDLVMIPLEGLERLKNNHVLQSIDRNDIRDFSISTLETVELTLRDAIIETEAMTAVIRTDVVSKATSRNKLLDENAGTIYNEDRVKKSSTGKELLG